MEPTDPTRSFEHRPDDPTDASTPPVNPVPLPLVGHPRYRVVRPLGEGGMGSVFLAEQLAMERLVALKIVRPALVGTSRSVQRFAQEVRAAARMSHENIVRAYDADEAEGMHFLVMEYVEGSDLASILARRGPLGIAEACNYARQVALGLQHAHELGTVHRDIKPANLMLTPDGRVKILDFGIARFTRGESATDPSTVTGSGTLLGTADYLAPEQGGDARSADIRADIYSLGCTLFHLLTGKVPFAGGSLVDKVRRHANEPPPDPAQLRPEIPADLSEVIRAMMAKDPRDRYRTPAEVAAALGSFLETGTIAKWPRRPAKRRKWAIPTTVGLLGLGVGAVLAVRNWPAPDPATGQAEPPPAAMPAPVPPQPGVEPPRPEPKLLGKVVVPDGTGDYTSLKAALLDVKAGDRIVVKPGTYRQDTAVVHTRVTVEGLGPPGSVVIESDDTTFHMTGSGIVFRNLTIRSGTAHAIFSEGGDQEVQDCDLTGARPNGIIVVQNERPRFTLRRSKVHGAATNGLHVGPGATVTVEDCDIYDNAFEGVVVDRNNQLIVRKSRIHDNRRAGVRCLEDAKARIEDTDIYGNSLAGVHIENRSEPWVIRCRVNRNGKAGIAVFPGGSATVEGCDLRGNLTGSFDIREDAIVLRKDNRED